MPNRLKKVTKAGIQVAHAPKQGRLLARLDHHRRKAHHHHLAQPPSLQPGLTLRDNVLPALALSVRDVADQLDVSRVALSRVVNGRAAISPVLASCLEACLGMGRAARPSRQSCCAFARR